MRVHTLTLNTSCILKFRGHCQWSANTVLHIQNLGGPSMVISVSLYHADSSITSVRHVLMTLQTHCTIDGYQNTTAVMQPRKNAHHCSHQWLVTAIGVAVCIYSSMLQSKCFAYDVTVVFVYSGSQARTCFHAIYPLAFATLTCVRIFFISR